MLSRNLPGELTKQNTGESRARGFKPAGALDNRAEDAENGCTVIFSAVLANEYNKPFATQNPFRI